MIKSEKFRHFSIKSYVMDVYYRGDSNSHPKHMILWRTYDNKAKNTGLLRKLYEYGDVHIMRTLHQHAYAINYDVYPLETNGLSHPYHLDESTFIYRGIRSDFSFLFHFSMKIL